MNFEDWTVDLKRCSATHVSGFMIEIEGSPRDPSAVHPGRCPAGISAMDQVRLLRFGLDALAQEAGRVATEREEESVRQMVKKSYQRPANQPRKPLLSLKKKNTD